MILRHSLNTAVHLAGGVALGVTAVLAACTLARLAQRCAHERASRPVRDFGEAANPAGAGSEPYESPAGN